MGRKFDIGVAEARYVNLSIATNIAAQHNRILAVDVTLEKGGKIIHRQSPIQHEFIENYLSRNFLVKHFKHL